MEGKLFLCATPIGNLEDMTFRAVRVLNEVDLIAAEDTRNSIKLLNHFEIKTPMTSYHEFNKIEKAQYLIDKMKAGQNIALITDAGTPGISDPGEELVRICYEQGIEVTGLPGACACVDGLILSGLSTRRFAFEAFLPKDKKERQFVLNEMKNESRTMIVYEAPHHLVNTLGELYSSLGNRNITITRELTKKFETVLRTSFEEAKEYYMQHSPKGEYVIIIEGKKREAILKEVQDEWMKLSLEDHLTHYEAQGIDRKEAMKKVALDRGISKRDVYQQLLERK